MIALLTASAALAVPPLVPVVDVAEPGLSAWWREGELLVGLADDPDRPGMRPLVGLAPIVLPKDLDGWTPVGAQCDEHAVTSHASPEFGLVGEVVGPADRPVVQVRMGDRVLANNTLGRPARICDVRLVQADKLEGPELIVAWRHGEGEGQLRGYTVFRVPETAQ